LKASTGLRTWVLIWPSSHAKIAPNPSRLPVSGSLISDRGTKTEAILGGLNLAVGVNSCKYHRRHMTQSQKGACAADAGEVLETCRKNAAERRKRKPESECETFHTQKEKKRATDEVGEMFGVSGRYVDENPLPCFLLLFGFEGREGANLTFICRKNVSHGTQIILDIRRFD
jgi:hypothetical protein